MAIRHASSLLRQRQPPAAARGVAAAPRHSGAVRLVATHAAQADVLMRTLSVGNEVSVLVLDATQLVQARACA